MENNETAFPFVIYIYYTDTVVDISEVIVFVCRFASPLVVKAYTLLLQDFPRNSQHTNHCLVKMLHRIAFECKMPGMLFQARLFRVFQKVMLEPAYKTKYFEVIFGLPI